MLRSGSAMAAGARRTHGAAAPRRGFLQFATGAPSRRGRVLLARSTRSGTACAGCDPFHTPYV